MGQRQIFFKNWSILNVSKSVTNSPFMMALRSQIPPLEKVQVCKNRAANVEARSNNTTYTFFGKNAKSSFIFFFNFDMV